MTRLIDSRSRERVAARYRLDIVPQVVLATLLHYILSGAEHEAGVFPWSARSDHLSMPGLQLLFAFAHELISLAVGFSACRYIVGFFCIVRGG